MEPSLANLADLVTVRNHLRMTLDSQYRNLPRDDYNALNRMVLDLDKIFLNAVLAYTAQPESILDPYVGASPEEIIAALKKVPKVEAGKAEVVDTKQLELEFDQKAKVMRGQKTVKANKNAAKKKAKATLDKETKEMNDKIAKAKKEVAGKKTKPKAIEPKGDGTES